MANTIATEVYDVFESSFASKVVIPSSLELIWLKKAVGCYNAEIGTITFNEDYLQFDSKLDQYTINTLGAYMKKFYQEREFSKVNKYPSVVMKDISIDGNNGTKNATKAELDYVSNEVSEMIENQKPSSFL